MIDPIEACWRCNETFSDRAAFVRHFISAHPDDLCPPCCAEIDCTKEDPCDERIEATR